MGERVVLFLEKVKGSPFMRIAHAGRGRLPLRDVDGKAYGRIGPGLIFPEGTPAISEEQKASGPIAFTYEVFSIESGVLRGLVKAAGR